MLRCIYHVHHGTYAMGTYHACHVTYIVDKGYVRRVAYAEVLYKVWHVSYFVGIYHTHRVTYDVGLWYVRRLTHVALYKSCPPWDLCSGYISCPPCDLCCGYRICPPCDPYCIVSIMSTIGLMFWVHIMPAMWPMRWVYDVSTVWPMLRCIYHIHHGTYALGTYHARHVTYVVGHRQNKPSTQLPQPSRSQTGKWEEFEIWTPISPGELIRQSPYCPGQGHSQQEVLSAHCSRSAFGGTFDQLQLIRATLIFKMQKDW